MEDFPMQSGTVEKNMNSDYIFYPFTIKEMFSNKNHIFYLLSVENTLRRDCDQWKVALSSSAINMQNECYSNSFKEIKISKNAANKNEENFSGLKSILPIKINGSYLGSNENINQINCLDQSIKERRRSLREKTPIKISGTQFIREMEDIENDPSSDSISVIVPFGQIFSEGRNPAQPFSNKMRFIPTKKSSQDFIENYPENKSSTSKSRESSFENVIHNMKNTLKTLKTNVTCKTLKEINREVTPFDLPDLDPLSEDVDQNRSMAITTNEIDGQVPGLKPLISGEGKPPDNIATHHNISRRPNIDIDLRKIQSESHTADDMIGIQAKYPFGGRLGKTGRKKSSFKNTISYLLSKALDDHSDSDSESNSNEFSEKSSISSSAEKSLSVTSFTSAGDEETCVSCVTDELDNVSTDRTSLTDCLDTDSYSWYFDLEQHEKNKDHLEGNRYKVPEENELKMTSRIKLEENCEKPLPAAGGENEMKLDVTGFSIILQRSVQIFDLKCLVNVFLFFPRLSEIEDKLDNLKNMEASVINKNKVEKDLQEQNQVNFSKDIRQVFIFIIFRTSS